MMRRATPDSEVLASSEDEKPWPHSTFGSLPRKENGMPGLGGGIWAHSRGSFNMNEQARRIAARDVRLGTVANPAHPSVRSANSPSPPAGDTTNPLPFAIPLQPTPKTGRSLSHSQGQREMPPSGMNTQSSSVDRAAALPLGLLNEAEEVDTESESELGVALTQTTSHPPIGTTQRNAAFPAQYDQRTAANLDRTRADTFNEALLQERLDRRFASAFGNLSLDQSSRKAQWQTSSGWDELHTINESRRHSLADIPTRRGSLSQEPAHDHKPQIPYPPDHLQQLQRPMSNHSSAASIGGFRPVDRSESFHIPDGYRVPHVALEPHERADLRASMQQSGGGRPRKMLYIVSFKCSRVGVFYLLDNTGLIVNEGDMVIVEADRGQDLGTVQHARVTPEEARALLTKYGEEQYKWLMMFSQNNQAGAVNPNAAVYGESSSAASVAAAAAAATGANGPDYAAGARPTPSHMIHSTRPPRDQAPNLKPKAIKRMAAAHEIRMLKEKEGNEAKAKRCCQQKVFQHHLDMEILEAEFQWDWQKLIFYYYADHYVNFKELVNDLYKLYKVRLWMSAVNPASFSPNAINQPPTGIGPGAVTNNLDQYRPDFDNSYSMTYGSDPDPYGAIPPYQVGYNTFVPNYPSIPGMANSFSPVPGDGIPARPAHGEWPGAGAYSSAGAPASNGAMMGESEHHGRNSHAGNMTSAMPRLDHAHERPELSAAHQRANSERVLHDAQTLPTAAAAARNWTFANPAAAGFHFPGSPGTGHHAFGDPHRGPPQQQQHQQNGGAERRNPRHHESAFAGRNAAAGSGLASPRRDVFPHAPQHPGFAGGQNGGQMMESGFGAGAALRNGSQYY